MRTPHPLFVLALALLAGAASPELSRADFFASGAGALGDYNLTLAYSPLSTTHGTLTATLMNTSPPANGGFLTAFVFNNPNNDITGASLTASISNFHLLGAPNFNNGVNGAPYGHFDIGASTFKSFEGGGNPAKGLGVGQTATFTFHLTGSGLNTLDEMSFVDALSVPPGNGAGDEFFVARFRGFRDEGSDKVPASPNDPPGINGGGAPEPTSLLLSAVGLLGFLGGVRRLRRRLA